MTQADPETRRALAGWVRYLRDIGVRDLNVGSGGPRTARSAAPPDDGMAAPRRPAAPPEDAVAASRRPAAPPDDGMAAPRRPAAPPREAATDPVAALQSIRDDLGDCTRCKLCVGRTNIVFGVGDPRARLMFVGEGPGADEDLKGEPFVGRAGQKLNEMIKAIGLSREQIYIANVVKCRPPDNRTPEPEEIATCSPFLFRQIEAIAPAVIVTLGAPAARTLTGSKIGITQLRGQWASFRGIPVMPTFHPAYLLRAYTLENRRLVFEDLKAARARLDAP